MTILYEGELEHRDSSGSNGKLGPGDVQWMTVGSGIVHEEYHGTEFTQRGGTLEMVQLWVNLKASDKTIKPTYQDLRDEQFPRVQLDRDAGTVRVIAGQFGESKGAASTFSPINVWDIELKSGVYASLKVPQGHTTVLIVQKGKLTANDSALKGVELVQFERDGESIDLQTKS